MKSLRLRMAALSTAISGLVIAGFGVAGWMMTARLLRESVDLRMTAPLDRIVHDLHPRTDLDRVFSNLKIGFGDDVEAGTLRLLLLDRDGSEIYRAPAGDWLSGIAPGFLIPKSPGPHGPRIPRPGADGGTPDPSDDSPTDREWQKFLGGFLGPENGGGENGQPPDPDPDNSPVRWPGQEENLKPPRPRDSGREKGRPPEAGPPKATFVTHSEDDKQWRLGILEDRGYIALMARDLSDYQGEIREVRRLFFLAFPICLLIIGIGGWFVARRAMRPVELIANTASRVTARGLDQRIPKDVHDYAELSHLVDVLNGMMDRLDGSFRHAVRFSADVSHELKTPLAVMQVAVQDALKECPPGSREEESLLTVSQETERLKRITRSLMLLAQADAGQLSTRTESFSLSREVEAVCEDAEILCETADLSFEADIEADVQANADPVLLRQAIQNLVSNAVKYNQPGGSVSCQLFSVDGAAETVIEISNTGPGIAEAEQDKIFDRFYRIDQSRSRQVDGFGLGLNLAWEIVRAMNGELLLVESNDKITRFQIRLKTDETTDG